MFEVSENEEEQDTQKIEDRSATPQSSSQGQDHDVMTYEA